MILALLGVNQIGFAQENILSKLTKPKLYENRILRSENITNKKLGGIKKIKENIVTHYNFYFNSNKKLNTVLESAKQSFKDDFDKLIPLRDFSINQTASMQVDLDSIILKCNNGILLHDLRNDWVDDLYLLMGEAYFYEKKFDSAYDVFQYINYTFQPRDKDEIGFEKTIGSNINNSGNVYTISTKENRGFFNLSKHENVRNQALVWIACALMGMDNDDEAKSMLDLLSKDNNFPERLFPLLSEKKAEWFIKKEQYDSAAYYLEKSLPICNDNKEKARRCFLIAQLYSIIKKNEQAYLFFEKSIANTTDPIMEAYARIQQIAGMGKDMNESKRIEDNIQALLSLTEKEKYQNFRSVIFSSIATLELKRNNPNSAIEYLKKSNLNNQDDQNLKNNNFLKIATLSFEMKKYSLTKEYLDSVDESSVINKNEILEKKPIINEISKNIEIIQLEDSLQLLGKLSELDRIKALSAILKNQKKEAATEQKEKSSNNGSIQRNNLLDQTSGALFSAESQKGEWYFNNPTLIAQGKIEFKNKWGERPNIDNWRRSATFNSTKNAAQNGIESTKENELPLEDSSITTMETLLENIPTTPEKLIESNERKFSAVSELGNIFKNKLDDCKESIYWNERLINEYSSILNSGQKYFDLSFCYKKEGNKEKSTFYQNLLSSKFPESNLNIFLKDPSALEKIEKEKEIKATNAYEEIYNLMISGKFDEALIKKKIADSTYGQNKWSPQLLYIESLYYINKKQDSIAIETLRKITTLYPNSSLSEKAQLFASVISRRSEIEKELTEKNIQKEQETVIDWIEDGPLSRTKVSDIKIDSMVKDKQTVKLLQPIKIDSTSLVSYNKNNTDQKYSFDLNETQFALLILNDVDIIYTNEAKRAITNYNNRSFSNKNLVVQQEKIDGKTILIISEFKNTIEAIDYIDMGRKLGPTEIFPWLPTQKYTFLLISPSNFKILTSENKILPYLDFIKIQLPGKF